MNTHSSYPFVVWTLQRTGGTNLATRLIQRSPYPFTQHEPFNPGRAYGHVTEQWEQDHDATTLKRQMLEICAKGTVIKHCVEEVPWEVTEALAGAACASGYRHIFLYRRKSLDRLLSLHFAKHSGVWGPPLTKKVAAGNDKHMNVRPLSDHASLPALPIAKLLNHERNCVATLNRAWQIIRRNGGQAIALAYEDIYSGAGAADAIGSLNSLLKFLGLSKSPPADLEWAEGVIHQGDQGTRDRYQQFPGVAELAKRLASVAPFAPYDDSLAVEAKVTGLPHPWVRQCFIDVAPRQLAHGQPFELGGVIVLSSEAPANVSVQLNMGKRIIPVTWQLPSQRMAREYPDSPNSSHARFQAKDIRLALDETGACLELTTPNSEAVPLACIESRQNPDFETIHIEPGDRLIIDVGANDGADTWFYLRKGFRVVAVEAIPELAENLNTSYQAQIDGGRLEVAPVAIAEKEGTLTFTINEDWTEWSSAHGASKASAGRSRQIQVSSTTLRQLIEHHGKPYYVKIDIEGGELAAVRSLQGLDRSLLPSTLSFEINIDWGEVLETLYSLGYREFQLVRQGAPYLPLPTSPSAEGLDCDCSFTSNMSGPFGKDLPKDRWVRLVEIVREVLVNQQQASERRARGENPGWFDVHARNSS